MVSIFTEILIIALSAFVMIAGGWMVTMNSEGQISPAMHMPMEMYYAGIPIGGVLMIVYGVYRLAGHLKKWKEVK